MSNVLEDMIERGISMAQCDEGYLCQVCGEEVKRIDQSLLYLRYVLGWITVDQLTKQPEAHLQCTPAVGQFIVDPDFQSNMPVEPALDKQHLDADFRQSRENLITAGYHRLKHLQKHRRSLTVTQYPIHNEPEPIPEVDGSTNNATA
ncbi:MAG: hypothetical protein Q8M16_15015 [Pirellulaceae bacterium]|nr:hypothetical protein [Pirellulaceae bacterium]